MTPKEAREKLLDIKFRYECYEISEEQALIEAKPFLEIYNENALKLALEHNVKPQLWTNDMIKWY